jgi:hypothetical protein
MREYELIGFIADLNGRQDTFFTADPVIQIGDRVYTAEAESWTDDDLRPLSPAGYEHVEMLSNGQRRPIHPGEVLWLVGDELADDIDAIHQSPRSDLERFKRMMSRWEKTVRRGYPWTVGPRAEFFRTARRPLVDVTRLLNDALFDRVEQRHGDIERYFAVFEGLAQEDTPDSLMTTALYYRERRDERRLRSVGRQAVRAKAASTVDEFLEAVEKQAARLATLRLSEVAVLAAQERHPDALPLAPRVGFHPKRLSDRQLHQNGDRIADLLQRLVASGDAVEHPRMKERL